MYAYNAFKVNILSVSVFPGCNLNVKLMEDLLYIFGSILPHDSIFYNCIKNVINQKCRDSFTFAVTLPKMD